MTHDRETIAAVAARLIVESQLTDWSLARRKAADQLGLSARATALPSDDEIIAEIKIYHLLFGGDEHAEQLRSQRETALEVMRALSRFEPRLVGPVAEGWAHEGSDVVIDLAADSAKDVEIELVNLGADVDAREGRDGASHLHIADADWPIRIVVRVRGRALDSRYKIRMNTVELKQLLSVSPN
jgi:hypothetical protein